MGGHRRNGAVGLPGHADGRRDDPRTWTPNPPTMDTLKGACERSTVVVPRDHKPLQGSKVRRRPTLPHRNQCSTIGAEGLNYRVRNGTGCFPNAITTETLWNSNQNPEAGLDRSWLFFQNRTVDA
jgi:hypothetical protein